MVAQGGCGVAGEEPPGGIAGFFELRPIVTDECDACEVLEFNEFEHLVRTVLSDSPLRLESEDVARYDVTTAGAPASVRQGAVVLVVPTKNGLHNLCAYLDGPNEQRSYLLVAGRDLPVGRVWHRVLQSGLIAFTLKTIPLADVNSRVLPMSEATREFERVFDSQAGGSALAGGDRELHRTCLEVLARER